jgi:hypothetical protein
LVDETSRNSPSTAASASANAFSTSLVATFLTKRAAMLGQEGSESSAFYYDTSAFDSAICMSLEQAQIPEHILPMQLSMES